MIVLEKGLFLETNLRWNFFNEVLEVQLAFHKGHVCTYGLLEV